MTQEPIGETMGDARFFARNGPYKLAAITSAAKGTAPHHDDSPHFTGVLAPANRAAGPGQLP